LYIISQHYENITRLCFKTAIQRILDYF